jgi:phospholipase/carboxylesterase
METQNALYSTFAHRYVPGDGRPTTLLLLHGTGGNEESLLDLGEQLLPGANLLSPRGKVLEHGMPRFFRRLAEGIFDEEDLHFRTNQLISFIQKASETYSFDRSAVVAVGYSNGANIAASVLLTEPSALSGAVLLRAMVPFVPSHLPSSAKTPVLLLSGDHDQMIPLSSARKLAEMLTLSGADVDQQIAHAGHSLTQEEFGTIAPWLSKFDKDRN